MKSFLLFLLAAFSISPTRCAAVDTSVQAIVGRSTNDRLGDLITALVRTGRFDDALQLCNVRSERADPMSDMAAKWAIRKSQILTAREMTGSEFSESEIATAEQPIRELLEAYPNHRRALFLKAQQIRVRKAAASHRVAQASISPNVDPKENAAQSLVRVMADASQLSKRVADARSLIDRQPEALAGIDPDLNRLQQELSVDVVSLSLMQTELFSQGSEDCIAAATKAEHAANQAINRIPADSPARNEVQRLKVQAILRAGQVKRAASEIDLLKKSINVATNPAWLALQIHIKLAQGNQQDAASLLSGYYADAPDRAPRSIEMDIARLEYLLLYQQDQIASWFDAIEQRGGDYARRRAESIALARVGVSDLDSKLDPALLAAQGRAWLRKGDRVRAGELLSVSASADNNSVRALRHASEAAAVFASVGQTAPAASVLIDTALAHKQSDGAAAAHLQAVMLLQSSAPNRIEELLRNQLKTWPAGTIAGNARRWLYNFRSDRGQFTDAAVALSKVPVAELTEDHFESIADAWRAAFHQSDDNSLAQPSRQFRESLRPLLKSPIVQTQYRSFASMLLNRDSLAGLPVSSPSDPFVEAFIDFRLHGMTSTDLQSVPVEHAVDARWRLIRDGRMLPQLRPAISKLLQHWDSEFEPTFDKAELLLWSAEIDSAIELLRNLIQASGRDVDALKQAATLLASTNDRKAYVEAIRHWDEVATGTTKGSPLWHEAKLAAIKLLQKNGSHEAAGKRAKYILLTMQKLDSKQKHQYQSVIP